jgi:hypothetical protein
MPHRSEPQSQRLSSVLENRSCRHGGLVSAGGTDEPSTRPCPSRSALTTRTDKTLGPPQSHQILSTVIVRSKSRLKFQQSPWVILSHNTQHYILCLVESIEYPLGLNIMTKRYDVTASRGATSDHVPRVGVSRSTASTYLSQEHNVKYRFAAVGEHGCIAVAECAIKTVKHEGLYRVPIIKPFSYSCRWFLDSVGVIRSVF